MFEVKPIEKVSKQGKPYIALEITFPCGYKKLVFLTKPEEILAQM